jgi:hypothetical protein
LYSANENSKTASNNKFEEAQERGPVNVDNKIDNRFHDGQGEDQSLSRSVHGIVDSAGELFVSGDCHVTGHACGGSGGLLCCLAAGEKVALCARDSILGGSKGELDAEDDKNERKNGVGKPSERNQVRELEIRSKLGRVERVSVVSGGSCVPVGSRGHGRPATS